MIIYEVEITQEMISNAEILAEDLGVLNNSIRNGTGNLAGFLGEECVLKCFKNSRRDNDYNHDILYNSKRIEVKTKDRTVVPNPDFQCSIPAYNTKQNADLYVFVSLLRKNDAYVKGFLLGYMRKEEYFKKAKLLKKGEIDTSNNFEVKADCWNLKIKDLHSF